MQQERICPENSIIIHASKYACFEGYSEYGFFRFTIQFLNAKRSGIIFKNLDEDTPLVLLS